MSTNNTAPYGAANTINNWKDTRLNRGMHEKPEVADIQRQLAQAESMHDSLRGSNPAMEEKIRGLRARLAELKS